MGHQLRGKTFDDFSVGDEVQTASRTITEADVVNFAGLSGDFNPLHTDAEFMKNSSFKERIAHGVLVLAVTTGLANQLGVFEGTTIAVMQMTTRFTGAVLFGDTIKAVLKCIAKKEPTKPDRGVATFKVTVLNQRDEAVTECEWIIMLRRNVE